MEGAVSRRRRRREAPKVETTTEIPAIASLRPTLTSVIIIVMVSSFPVVLAGAMSVQMRPDIGFDNQSLGLAVTCYYIVSAALSPSCGRLTERIGSQQSLRAAAVLAAIACAGIAVTNQLAVMVVFLVVGGVSVSLAQPAGNAVIIERVPMSRRGLAFGIKQSSIPAGTVLAGLAVPVVGLTVGWRPAFVGAAVLAIVAAFTVPPNPERDPLSRRGSGGQLRGSYGLLIVLAAAAALGAAPSMSLPVFVTSSAVERGISNAAAGALLALGSIAGLSIRLAAGARADRRSGGHLRPIATLMAFGTLGLFAMAFDNAYIFTLGIVFSFGAGWAWQGLFNHAVTNRWTVAPAAATGITQTGVFVGGILGPVTFGWVTSRWSDNAGWVTLGVMMALATVLILGVRRWSSPTPSPATPTAGAP